MSKTERNIFEENAQTNEQTMSENENTSPEALESEHVNDIPDEQTSEKNMCPNCQKAVEPNEPFCSRCGYKVGLTEQEKILKEEIEKKKERKKKTAKLLLKIFIPVAIVVAALIVCFIYRKPIFYSFGSIAYNNEHYSISERLYNWAGDYKESKKYAKLSNNGVHYQDALEAMDKCDYLVAYDEFVKAESFNNAKDKKSEAAYLAANQYFEQKEYNKATEYYQHCPNYEDTWEKLVFIADMYINQNEFEKASSAIGKCDNVTAVAYKKYADGMIAFNNKKYEEAASLFTNAASQGLYDASEKELACNLMIAENLLKNGKFNEGKEAYSKLPHDFTYNNINVANRVSTLNGMSSFANVSGKWNATNNYIESRNVYKRTGSWDSWYYSTVFTDQTLEVNCYLNSDGTVTIKGNVSFYRFTDYSSLSAYCKATKTTKYFTISNVKSIPYSYKIDNDTTLKYSGGIFSISYSVRDNYSSSFYNLYSSSVTYGNRTSIY